MRSKPFIFRFLLVAIIIMFRNSGHAQSYVYVNTDNLIMRDRPEKTYKVFAILHAPCKLEVEEINEGYAENKAIVGNYYQVAFRYKDERGISHYTSGYVMKKHVVKQLSAVTVKGVDTTNELAFTEIPADENEDPDEFNCAMYTYPKYKGGELQFEPGLLGPKIYMEGPRGGCFYLSKNGKRIYVDRKFCNGAKQ
jgi:hypothetical protein